MGLEITKQRLCILGESLLKRSVKAFSNSDIIDFIVVVCRENEIAWAKQELCGIKKTVKIVSGGKTRAESARLGFASIPGETDFVAIHDAARCLVTERMISDVVSAAEKHGAATAATPVVDTIKIAEGGFVFETVPRDLLFSVQTPQVFSREIYESALDARPDDALITDDNMLVENIGKRVFLVDTGRQNIKITTAEDIKYAEYILDRREYVSEIRSGHGYDVHRLVEGRRLVLGGVEITHTKGLLGHSDADVLTHAVMDALLGACALGDIGRHFPDTVKEYEGISSLVLLKKVRELVSDAGFDVVNIDATIVAQRPKLSPYINEMIANFAEILGIEQGRINVKATTEEHLGFTGREEGISAHAIVTVKK
nr:2-C-methyl-D-erythritol 2,4-cyclodiphosphate synthase [Oscillospiraceae bacterium]